MNMSYLAGKCLMGMNKFLNVPTAKTGICWLRFCGLAIIGVSTFRDYPFGNHAGPATGRYPAYV